MLAKIKILEDLVIMKIKRSKRAEDRKDEDNSPDAFKRFMIKD